jgi:hypothetical protein
MYRSNRYNHKIADTPMEVTKLGMVTEVKPLQPKKVPLPMEVTELPIVSEINVFFLNGFPDGGNNNFGGISCSGQASILPECNI